MSLNTITFFFVLFILTCEKLAAGLQNEEPDNSGDLSKFSTKYLTSPAPTYKLKSSWTKSPKDMGPVTGVAFDNEGHVVVLHRADRFGNRSTFDETNRFLNKDLGPIPINTIYVIDNKSGKILREFGKNMFYSPHGITVGPDGCIYVTDPGLQQVIKFEKGSTTPLLTLGEAFVPGSDDKHFCRPTQVAVMTSGYFFVSDGFCNHRIIKFTASGQKIWEIGRDPNQPSLLNNLLNKHSRYALNHPHSVALAEEKNLIMVADRTPKIICFSASKGKFRFSIKAEEFGKEIAAVAYSPINGGTIIAVNDSSSLPNPLGVTGFVIPLSTRRVGSMFSPGPNGFSVAHGLAVSRDGNEIIVGILNKPYKVWKFQKTS